MVGAIRNAGAPCGERIEADGAQPQPEHASCRSTTATITASRPAQTAADIERRGDVADSSGELGGVGDLQRFWQRCGVGHRLAQQFGRLHAPVEQPDRR